MTDALPWPHLVDLDRTVAVWESIAARERATLVDCRCLHTLCAVATRDVMSFSISANVGTAHFCAFIRAGFQCWLIRRSRRLALFAFIFLAFAVPAFRIIFLTAAALISLLEQAAIVQHIRVFLHNMLPISDKGELATIGKKAQQPK